MSTIKSKEGDNVPVNTKKNVLALLEGSRGQAVSGERIAERLNLSRNAVWKAVKELEKDGYKITAVTNKGYCLSDDNDILSAEGISVYLPGKTGNITVYPTLESTNKTAKELAVAGGPHGTVIIADSQTDGKGRYGRGFHSPPGCGIYMSIILRPSPRLENPTLVTAYTAVSVCEAIEALAGKLPGIKWVNDIFLKGKKICGISTEAVTDFESGCMQWIVVGIGINFTQPADGFPEGLRDIAGAVFSDGKPPVSRNRLAADIINRMSGFNGDCDGGTVFAEYRKRLITPGRRITVSGTGTPFEADALDIDDAGRLIVKKDDGETLTLLAGEVSHTFSV
jgi:BirA family biotin operon repressor/biotin-[acetyl-CoA-carboxylase] ligase